MPQYINNICISVLLKYIIILENHTLFYYEPDTHFYDLEFGWRFKYYEPDIIKFEFENKL